MPGDAVPERLSFTYTQDELAAYGRLVSARQNRLVDGSMFWSMPIVFILAIALVVALAKAADLITASQVRPVAVTAYAAFITGALTYYALAWFNYRQLLKAVYARAGATTERRDMLFDANGVSSKNLRVETHISWRSIEDVTATDVVVVIWIDITQGFPIPARVFPDATARQSFVGAVRQRIAAAKGNVTPPGEAPKPKPDLAR